MEKCLEILVLGLILIITRYILYRINFKEKNKKNEKISIISHNHVIWD
jgi:hypothetical protein